MRLYSPIPIFAQKFSFITFGLLTRKSPINLIIPPYGLVKFIPVQVSNIRDGMFDSRVLFNAHPVFEINTIQKSFLPYAYNTNGTEVNVSTNYLSYSTMIDYHLLRNIRVSSDLENYDILLCYKQIAPTAKYLN